jgi:hypothetical protein
VTPDGALLGALPPTPTETPWWQDIEPVVRAVRENHGIDITVLRLLAVGEPGPSGVEITYLAETADAVSAAPWEGGLDEHPLRLPYARPGGPDADLAWAQAALTDHGFVPTGPPVQVRTWNLSSLWRIPVEGQTLWLKVVPPFFAHEGALVAALAGSRVPRLVAHEPGRMLMTEIAGEDLYGAPLPMLLPMIDLLVDLQRGWTGRTRDLVRLGLPDRRGAALAPAIEGVFTRTASQLAPDDRSIVEGFVAGLERRFADVAACGLPDTLVHGDFHPGNLRGGADALTLLDWGDSFVGNPLLDQPAFLDRIASAAVAPPLARGLAGRGARIGPRPGLGPARPHRRGPAGGDLSGLPRPYRALGASLPSLRSGRAARANCGTAAHRSADGAIEATLGSCAAHDAVDRVGRPQGEFRGR